MSNDKHQALRDTSRQGHIKTLNEHIDAQSREIAELKLRNHVMSEALWLNGFVPCDIPACNCGSWHARYGLIERYREIVDLLVEAGHPLCNENGNLAKNALSDLIADHDRMREALQNIADTPTCDCCGGSLEGAVYAAELALKECEQ